MEQKIVDVIVVLALTAAVVAWLYFRSRERQRRMQAVHEERMAAMEKGIPLPELPFDPPKHPPQAPDPRATLLHGIVWTAFGLGGIVTLLVTGQVNGGPAWWPLPVPLLFLGVGLILYYVIASRRR
jgi:hypothetical protein